MKLKEQLVKHTSGPWRFSYNSVTTALEAKVVDADGHRVCEFPDPTYANARNGIKSEAETKANARLIAAAPEMLVLLEEVSRLIDRDATGGDKYDSFVFASGIQTQIVRVIAKAKGEL